MYGASSSSIFYHHEPYEPAIYRRLQLDHVVWTFWSGDKYVSQFGIHLPSIYGKLGIILVFTFKLFPYVYLYTSGAMGSIDSSLEEAAENLGSNKLRRLWTITLPVVLPSIAAGAIMVFMTSLADFGTPMLIGEGYMVLPVLVYNEYMSEIGGNAHLASALSVVVVFCSTTVLLVQKHFVTKKTM